MTLRALISFDHVPLNTNFTLPVGTTYASNTLNTQYGMPGGVMTGLNAAAAAIYTPTNAIALGPSPNSGYNAGYVVSLADLGWLQNGATQGWMGFRTYASSSGSTTASVAGFLTALSGLTNSGSGIASVLTEAQLARPGYGATALQYVEVFVDMTALTYQTYVNGIQTASGSLPSGCQYVVFGGTYYTAAGGGMQAYRDFYFLDVDATKPNGRLGPITSTALAPSVSTSQLANYGNFSFALNGSATVSNAQAKFGTASLYPTPSTNGAVVITDAPQYRAVTGDMTYECWAMCTNASQSAGFLCKDSGAAPWARLQYVSGVWQLLTDQASGTPALSATGNPTVNQWFHLALVRYQGTWTIYQNGVAIGSVAGGTFGNNTANLVLGNNNNLSSVWTGYIDEFRVSNIARYTANFTPSTQPFATDANTMLLMHFDSVVGASVADYSNNEPSAFQTAYGATPTMTPLVQNGADNQPIALNFAPSVPAGQKVVAMQYKLAAQVPFAMNLLASMQEGQTTKTLATYQFRDTTAQYARDLAGIQVTAPDGNGWTSTNIAATNLVLQPQSTTAANTN
jgi:hypothetical protein